MTLARALTAAGRLVRGLSHARQANVLYPPGHPHRAEAARALVTDVHDLCDAMTGDPTLFVDRHAFYLGTTLLAQESLSCYRLADDFARRGVESVTFEPRVSAGDLEQLIDLLLGQRPPATRIGGLGINQIRPFRLEETAWQQRLHDLRRAYAAALEVVREASDRAATDRGVDLEAAHEVVAWMAEEVARDPGYGLLLSAIKSHDEYTYYHMVNVCVLSIALAQLIGLHRDQVVALGLGGLFHDIGKLSVPADILQGVGPLDDEQWRLIQRHPVVGAGLIFSTGSGLYHPAASVVLEHHAAYDASGYPRLVGRKPSVPARLVAVADCFDAVTTKRSYREALDRDHALRIIEAGTGTGFDPRVVRVFQRLLGSYPVGTLVRLSSGETAVVVRNDPQAASRPTVLVILDAAGDPAEVEERDLSQTAGNGTHRWSIVAVVGTHDVGVDLSRLVATGTVQSAADQASGPGGLVHEPSPGEAQPRGYVDSHAEHGHDHGSPEGRPDPDVAPPFED